MDIETCILRFRDLVTDDGGTIARHKEIIDSKGYVWWGWWKKAQQEKTPDEFSLLGSSAKESGLVVYLLDSGQKKLYKANCDEIISSTKTPSTPPENAEFTPEYYKTKELFAWFRLSKIEEVAPSLLQGFSNVESKTLFVDKEVNYSRFDNKKICSLDELIQQNRTVWFIRPFRDGDNTEKIVLLNSSYPQPSHFSKKYFQADGDTLLWLSDLHLADNVFSENARMSENGLADHIRNAISNRDIAGLLISGDITSRGSKDGFTTAKKLIAAINSTELKTPFGSENILICPGNHDFKREEKYLICPAIKETNSARITVTQPDSCKSYFAKKPPLLFNKKNTKEFSAFYESIFKLKPNEYFASGKRFLLSSGHIVEILALNSVMLQQYKDFEGHGYISTKQLRFAEREMQWDKPCPNNVIRVAMMHHHYLPTCLNEEVDSSRSNNAAIFDADEVMSWLLKHDVKILLHGHKHRRKISKLLYPIDNEKESLSIEDFKPITIVGMGGTAAYDSENLLALLKFDSSKLIIEMILMKHDKVSEDRPVQTIEIPL